MPVSLILFFLGIGWGLFYGFISEFLPTAVHHILISSLQVLLLALVAEIINHRTPNFYKKIVDE